MDEEFDRGLIAGSWILLLDSFDEIPDILSSTEADNAVEEYALAIHNFLFGMRKSRAIVASREFRGPKTFREPRFQIVALSGRRQADLIRRSGLHPDQVRTVEGGLAIADSEIRQSATNPMFLGLICEYVQATGRFPGSSYSVYESYLTQRLSRDAERIQKRYKVSVQLVRALAEEIAFSMAAELGLGLSPTRKALRSALIRTDYIPIARLDAVLNALEYIKLGRAGENTGGSGEPSFTFAHRRFQEYFATCVVIRNPERVSVAELLVDGRWRETAVTIMQTQPMTAITPLLEEATRAIAPMTRKAIEDEERQTATGGYCWPPGAMHLLAVLSAGLGQTPENIPSEFRADAGSLLMSAWNKGRRYDKKWALSFALVARKDDTIWLLDEAFASGSLVLGGEAYLCVSRLADPPLSLYEGVRKTLVEMAASGDLTEQKVALNAQVRRLPGPRPLIRTLRLLSLAPKIDYALAAIQVLICAVILWPSAIAEIILVTIGLMGYRRMLFTQTVYRLWGTNLIIRPNSWIFSATVIYARLSAPVFPIVVAFAVPPRSPLIVVVACIAGTYFAGWPAEVGYVCKHRRSTSEFSWPLIPIFALVGVLRRLVIIIRQASMPKLLRTALPVVLFYGILIWAGVAYVPSLVTSRNGSLALKFIAIGLAVVGGIAACCLIAFYLYRRYYEARLIRSIANGRQWSIVEIFIILGRVQTPRGMRLLIELLLQIDFVAHPEILRLLSDIAAAAEVSDEKSEAQKKNAEAMVIPGVTAEFSEWIKGSHAEPTLLDWLLNLEWIFSRKARLSLPYSIRNVQKPMLDQIARAVEQVEIARGFTVS
jgi:hypothetical protein